MLAIHLTFSIFIPQIAINVLAIIISVPNICKGNNKERNLKVVKRIKLYFTNVADNSDSIREVTLAESAIFYLPLICMKL